MFIERVVPPGLRFRNRSPKRSPRVLRQSPAKRSLVNCNHLATSDTNLVQEETLNERLKRKTQETQRRAAQLFMHRQLKENLNGIALRSASRSKEEWLNGLEPIDGVESTDKRPWSAARDFRRLDACQTEWIGFKPSCCNSRAVAVPIGCNHRLCPRCNAARLERYRGPARQLLGAMEYPTFLTLTVPNVVKLTKKTFSQIRGWWKEFNRSNKRFLRGGLYAIEVTSTGKRKLGIRICTLSSMRRGRLEE
jgi:hypothetical protein